MAAAAPAAPKLDLKMLVLPAVLYFSRGIDFKDVANQQFWLQVFITSVAVTVGVHGLLYTFISSKADDKKKIWVPPKAKPTLPFGLGPAEEPLKPEDYKESTYKEHEFALLKEGVQTLLSGAAISFFMGYKFEIYVSLLIQSVSTPMALFDNILFKKYALGVTKGDNGAELYGELFSQPTEQSLAIAQRVAAARAALAAGEAPAVEAEKPEEKLTPSVVKSAIDPSEPRVEEIPVDNK